MSALIGDADTDKTTVHTAIEGAHVAAGGRRFVPLAPTTQAREAMVEKRAFRLKTSGAARGFARVANHVRQVAVNQRCFARVAMELMRHSDLKLTLKVYSLHRRFAVAVGG